ncbi:helix-turn-helix transcriptional regulator [Streptomyces sp. NPDC057654]|uniref:helix-turn-helix transcriptional regulator n=1 Tax=Streptomyces sp. NPDC057654 TaxID=3346196 RepID=UPI0036908309
MPPVFAHGRLRLYLLKLLDEAPRHGYEVIRLLEERFQGLYAPSAGTVYPRLAKLEAEGLVTHATEGGRKVYSITGAGRAELADRQGELADLELEIRESVSELAAEIREDVRGSANDLRREMREAARETRAGSSKSSKSSHSPKDSASPRVGFPDASDFFDGVWGDKEGWQRAKEEFKQAKQEWKEQARRAKEESRRARQDAQQARRQAKQAQDHARDEVLRIKERVQEQVREHARHGDWPSGILEGVNALAKELGALAGQQWDTTDRPAPASDPASDPAAKTDRVDLDKNTSTEPAPPAPEWATADDSASENPPRDLDRLLDRFRDDIRDAARDHGVTPAQLSASRSHLARAAAHIDALLRTPKD